MKLSKLTIYPSFVLMLFLICFGGHFHKLKFLIFSFLLHELAHLIFIKLYDQKISSINFTGIGFIINCKFKNITLFKKIIISASGILVNLFVMIGCYILKNDMTNMLFYYNKLLLLINLIPILPLDGGFILKYLLSYIYDDEYVSDLLLWIGILIIVIVVIIAYIFHLLYLYMMIPLFIKSILNNRIKNDFSYLNNYINIHKLSIK